jgi:hypothetical protein
MTGTLLIMAHMRCPKIYASGIAGEMSSKRKGQIWSCMMRVSFVDIKGSEEIVVIWMVQITDGAEHIPPLHA